MKSTGKSEKKNTKLEKMSWRQLEKLSRHQISDSENTKQLRVVQSVKAGHIRGGHGFH